jgi:hypothetical protein
LDSLLVARGFGGGFDFIDLTVMDGVVATACKIVPQVNCEDDLYSLPSYMLFIPA